MQLHDRRTHKALLEKFNYKIFHRQIDHRVRLRSYLITEIFTLMFSFNRRNSRQLLQCAVTYIKIHFTPLKASGGRLGMLHKAFNDVSMQKEIFPAIAVVMNFNNASKALHRSFPLVGFNTFISVCITGKYMTILTSA